MLGLARTDASTAALLLNLEGLATMGIAWILFREPVDERLLIGAGAILAGALLLSWRGAVRSIGLGCSRDCRGLRRLGHRQQPDPQTELGRSGADRDGQRPRRRRGERCACPHQWRYAARVVVPGRCGFGGLFRLRRQPGSVRARVALPRDGAGGGLFSCAPFIGAALSVFMFQEPITARLISAGLLMAAGVYLHLSEAHEHAHEAVEHEHRQA